MEVLGPSVQRDNLESKNTSVLEEKQQELVRVIEQGNISDIKNLLESSLIPEENIFSSEVFDAVKKSFSRLSIRNQKEAKELLGLIPLPKEYFYEIVEDEFIPILLNLYSPGEKSTSPISADNKSFSIGTRLFLLKDIPFFEEIVSSEKLIDAAKEGVDKIFDRNKENLLLEAITKYIIEPTSLFKKGGLFNEVSKHVANFLISEGRINYLKELLEALSLPESFLSSPQACKIAKEGFEKVLLSHKRSGGDNFLIFLDSLDILKDIQNEVLIYGLHFCFLNNMFSSCKKILSYLSLSNNEVAGLVQISFQREFLKGSYLNVENLLEDFPLPEEVVTKMVLEVLEKNLLEGKLEEVKKILDRFPLPKEVVSNMFDKNIPDFDLFINTWKQYAPKILEKNKDTSRAMLELYQKKDLIELFNEYAWVKDIFSANEKFSEKLLFKLTELDELSKENIDFLYTRKQTILSVVPDVDPNSGQFRKLMQQELLLYKNNKDILMEIKESGVHIENWLSHDVEQSFVLGKAAELSFAETIRTPIDRIKEALDVYKTALKKIFGEYQKELQEYRIPLESAEDIRREVDVMQERIVQAIAAGQEGKAKGMQKGLESLKQRQENPKTAPLWQKLTGDFDAVVRVGMDVEKAHRLLSEKESMYKKLLEKKLLSADERQIAFEYKKQIDMLLEDFNEKIILLDLRMGQFKDSIQVMVEPCLGEDRTVALSQELNDATFEILDHFTSDVGASKNALEQLLSEQDNNKLEGRFLKVGLWGRNPDTDLYLGNYTDCCIRIDSEHMGEESTIADYLTDLGMQVLTVTDETSGEPIVAAWVYIGEDELKKPKFVIDNIEANREYAQYFPVIQEQLEAYVTEYARIINIVPEDISQGKNNNDITLNVEVGDYYVKLGGYNRADGYYLEAEPDYLAMTDEYEGDEDED